MKNNPEMKTNNESSGTRKLYKLRNWYSLNDAAKRLSITLNEEVLFSDILYMAVEGHLPLSWNMRLITAQRVAPVTHICDFDEFHLAMLKKVGREHEYKPKGKVYAEGYEAQGGIEHLDGIYKLELKVSVALKDWLLSLANSTEARLVAFEGFCVSDDEGNLWRIMDRLTAEERKAYGLVSDNEKGLFHAENYFPSDDFPNPADLGIRKKDLEEFEALVAEEPLTKSKTKSAETKERNKTLQLIYALLQMSYKFNKRSEVPTAAEISRNLLDETKIRIDDQTISKHLNPAVELYFEEQPMEG